MRKLIFILSLFISLTAISQPEAMFHANNVAATVTSPYTNSEVSTWSTASGVSSTTILNALDALISSGKTHGWWATKSSVYLLAAGDATKSKFNIISPVDDDAHYRLTTNGTVSYASTGVTSDGSTGYINTHFIPSSSSFTTTSGYMSLYVNTDVNEVAYDMGEANNGSDVGAIFLITRYSNFSYGQYGNGSYSNGISNSNSIGYWAVNRDGGTTYLYKNGSSIKNTTESATLGSQPIGICTYINNGSPMSFSTKRFAFSTIGSMLTSTQASDEYNDVLTFLTAIGAN